MKPLPIMQKISNLSSEAHTAAYSEKYISGALSTAWKIGREAKLASTHMKSWVHQTLLETNQFLTKLKAKNAPIEKVKMDLALWETHVMEVLRDYMHTSSTFKEQLLELNPPLTSADLKPFLEGINLERTSVILALEPLTKSIEQLSKLKKELFNTDKSAD